MKSIVLAEKPSVGKELARVLNCKKRTKHFIEGDKYIVTWAMGHLAELKEPGDYDKAWKHWKLDVLPMLPEKMKIKAMKKTFPQLKAIKELMKRNDVAEVIIATDAGREGELVARWIMQLGGWKRKPFKRLWISSQTDEAIKDGFSNLKDGHFYDNLYQAAQCRAEADWLVGLNVTRALTCKYDAQLNAGRVQTPTLSLLVTREEEIKKFVSKEYYNIKADFGNFYGLYKTNGNAQIFDFQVANELKNKLSGKKAKIISYDKKKKTENPPLAYDLTELQRDANRKYSFTAKETLSILQKLYEHHKIVTYPRTDSRYITKDIVDTLPSRLESIKFGKYKVFVEHLQRNGMNISKRFVNDSKVSDHHALIPTGERVNFDSLTTNEKRIYDLILKRFLSVLYQPYIYEQISVEIGCEGESFFASGKRTIDLGWKNVSQLLIDDEQSNDENLQNLQDVKKDKPLIIKNIKIEKKKTTPPNRYTEATLLSAMENPGKFIKEKNLKDAIKEGGLGTPATRAEIIEKLVSKHYVMRDGKSLMATAKAKELIRLVPIQLKSPHLTAQWELRLDKIAKGTENPKHFIKDIKDNTISLVNEIKISSEEYSPENMSTEKCPECGNFLQIFKDGKGKINKICSNRKCNYESGKEPPVGLEPAGKMRKNKFQDKQLLKKYGKDKNRREETLGDLFDF